MVCHYTEWCAEQTAMQCTHTNTQTSGNSDDHHQTIIVTQQFISIKISFTWTSIIIFHFTIRDFGGDANNETAADNNTIPHIYGEWLQKHVPNHRDWMAKHKARPSVMMKTKNWNENKLNRDGSRYRQRGALFLMRKSWPSSLCVRISITVPIERCVYIYGAKRRRREKTANE